MADDLEAQLATFQKFATDVARDLDRLSLAQREVLRDALQRIETEQLVEIRKSISGE